MKSMITKKLLLRKVTISTHKIYGASDTAPSQNESGSQQTLSSAFHDPTESQIDPMLLSFNEDVCI